jgi:hypothetical protein
LRQDRRYLKVEEEKQLETLRVVVADSGNGALGRALIQGLKQALPNVMVTPLGLNSEAAEAMGAGEDFDLEALSTADAILGPWNMVLAAETDEAQNQVNSQAIASSPAHKLLIPVAEEGWDWIGTEELKQDTIVKETVEAIKQLAAGEQLQAGRRLTPAMIVGIVIAVVSVLCLLLIAVSIFMEFLL